MSTTESFGGEIILRSLENQGIEDIIASPGSDWMAVWEALAKEKEEERKRAIRYYNCRHEDVAVGVAMGYWKMRQRMPAVLLHTAVGTLHTAMALRTACHDRIPMFVAAGESSTFGEDPGTRMSFQWLRFLSDTGGPERVARPLVKWSATVGSVHTLPSMIEHACRIALTPPEGPVFLSVPIEVMLAKSTLPQFSNKPTISRIAFHSDPADVSRVARLLHESKNPLIITEEAGRTPKNVDLLVELAEMLSIPVIEATNPTFVNFPRDHHLHLGFDTSKLPFTEPDLILTIEAPVPWYPSSKAIGGPKTMVVSLDEDPTKEFRTISGFEGKVDILLAGSVSAALEELIKRVKELGPSTNAIERMSNRTKSVDAPHSPAAAPASGVTRRSDSGGDASTIDAQSEKEQAPSGVDATEFLFALNRILPKDAIVVDETITHTGLIKKLVMRTKPGTYVRGALGGLGLGMPISLGVKKFSLDKNQLVVFVVGDGSFNYNPVIASLGFIQEYDAPVLIIVMDNHSYASMKMDHLRYYPTGSAKRNNDYYGVSISPGPDYTKMAAGFGGFGEQINDLGQVDSVLARSIERVQSGNFVMLQVLLKRRDNAAGD